MRRSSSALRGLFVGAQSRLTFWFAAVVLVMAALLWPQAARAQVASPRCPAPFTLSIPNAGSGTVNANACHEGFGIGFLMVAPLHGSVTIDTLASTVTYAHNGDSALSDTFRFDDGSGFYVQVNVTIGPASSITIAPASLPALTAGTSFSQTLAASGGVGPYTYTLDSGTLPTGLALSSAGVLSGTPTQRGPFAFSVRATDATAAFGVKSYNPTVAGGTLSLTPNPPPNGVVTAPYSVTFTPSGGVTPMSLMWEPNPSFPLPPGLTLSGNTLSGTPTTAGSYTFGIRVTDSSTGPGSWFQVVNVTMTVTPPPTIVVNPATVPGATVGVAYSQTVTGSGGTAPYSFAVTAGALPAGLTLSSAGALTGTATAGGSFNFTVTATDNNGFTGSRAYTLTVAAPAITVAPTTLPSGTQSVAYSQTITASGGTAPRSFAVTAGSLPAGISLGAGGALTGTPTVAGIFNFTVTATDSSTGTGAPYTGSRAYSLTIASAVIIVSPTTLPSGTVAAAYNQTLTASGGAAPYGFAVTAGALPAGLSLSTAGVLSGTPTAGGSFNITVTATDANSGNGSRSYLLLISPPVVSIAPASLPDGAQAVAYSQAITASGGTAPYGYAITAGVLPAGMTLSAAGVLSGTPTGSGTFNFSVTATDSSTGSGPYTGSRAYSLTIAAPVISVSPATLPGGTVAAAYSQAITASGGTAPYTFAVTAGALPVGLTMASDGTLSGTPTAGGSFSFDVTATDALGFTGALAYTVNIAAPTISVDPATLPDAAVGSAYLQTVIASGGTAPYAFAVTAGTLPAGISLAANGTLSGTPTAGGSFSFTVSATDSSTGAGPYTASRAYTLTVAAATVVVLPATLVDGTLGAAYSQNLSATGGTSTYTFAISAGALPPGLAFSSSGVLSGTPTATGTFNFTVTATDSSTGSGPYSGSRAYSVVVADITPVANAVAATVAYGSSTNPITLNVTGGVPDSVSIGSAPVHGIATASGTTITYTPTAGYAGPDSFTYTASNSAGTSAPATVSITVADPTITITPNGALGAIVGGAFSQTFNFSGGAAPYSGAVTGLPAGLAITATTADSVTVSGTPSDAGTFSLTVSATDSSTGNGPFTVNQAVTLDVLPPALTLPPAAGPFNALVGASFSQAFTATGGSAPYAYAITAGVLPPGLSLDAASGLLSGSPTAAGTFNFTLTATDSSTGAGAPFSISRSYVVQVDVAPVLVLSPSTLPDGTAGLPYSQAITASGGVGPYGFTVIAGALPAGLTLSPGGLLSGTTLATGTFNFTLQGRDAGGTLGSQAYSLVIAAPTIVFAPATLPDGVGGVAYSQTVTATGGAAPYAFSLVAGSLPAGLSLSSAGVLAGTPTTAGTFSITIRATDANGFTGDQVYSLVIAAPTIVVAPATLPDGLAGVAYSQALSASGGTGPYSFSLLAGALPAGMSFSSGGVLSGTPTAAGTFNITVRATDALGFTGDLAYALVIAAPTIAIAPPTLPDGLAGVAYSQTLTASGGTGPHTFSLLSGSLPTGMSFSSGGVLSGTPTVAGSFNFTVRATDALGFTADLAYALVIAAPTLAIAPATLPDGVAGVAYSQSITASGGTGPYGFSLLSGTLPAGMSFSSAGVLSGTPVAAGTFNFTVRATDALGFSVDQAYGLVIAAPAVVIAPATLPDGNGGVAYSQSISASGGTGPYSFSLLSGTLPTGISFSSAGLLSGTPVSSGTFNFTVRATDALGFSADQAYALVIIAPSIVIAPATLPDGVAGVGYSQNLTASGGTGPYGFSVVAGSLPTGLTLSSAGVLSGTPTADGTFNFTVRATDALGFGGDQAYAIAIGAPVLAITPDTLADALAGSPYSQSLAATGGVAPYSFSLVSGGLPSGLGLTSSGDISGIPLAGGTFAFTVRVTDANGFTGDQAFSLFVETPVVVITPDLLPDGAVGFAYSQLLSAAGGIAPYTFTVAAGALPGGLTLASDGTFSGTPTASGTFNFTIRATDLNGFYGEQAYALTIAPPPTITITPAALVDGVVGSGYSQTLTATGGTSPYTFAVTSGALPPGISLATTGSLAGTPTATGGFSFQVTATDGLGFTGTHSFTLTIADALPVAVDDAASTDAGTPVTMAVTANDSGTIGSIALASTPAHGTAVVAGLEVQYTPASGFAGSDSFTYTATGPGGTSNVATVSVEVIPLPVPTGVPQTVTTLAGQPVSLDAATGATGAPFTGVTLVATPPQGAVEVAGTTITYTPAADASGSVTIAYTLNNAFGPSAPITSTVIINPLPIAVAHSATTLAGIAVDVNLTEGASGGPFTAADVVTIIPAAAGTTLVTAAGAADARQYVLTFTPSAGFVGTAQVSYTLGNAFATSSPAVVTIDVTARPDPTQDAEVQGLLVAQSAAAKRFAHGQIDNFQSRMERLHDAGAGQGFDNGLTVAITRRCLDGRAERPGERCADEPLGSPVSSAASPAGETASGPGSQAPVGIWTAGAMAFGDYDLRGPGNGFEFETSAVSLGVDYRFSPGLVLGGGVGYGRDVTDVGDNGTRSEASARSLALYGSHQPADNFFVDLLLGYQSLSYDSRRHVTATGGMVTGDRDGDQWFGSLSTTYEKREESYTLAPYLRLDVARGELDAFTEQGDPVYALHYSQQDVDSTTGNLGLRVEFRRRTGWGLFSPLLRLEYQHDFEDPGVATLTYADLLGGPFYRTRLTELDSSRFLLGVGAILQTEHDWLFKAEYRGLFGNDDQDEHSIMLNVEKQF